MSYGLASPVLVLNRSFQPVRLTTARDAFEMLFVGRALALDEAYETHDFERWLSLPAPSPSEAIGTTIGPIRIPRLMVLRTFNRVPGAPVRLSRRNVFLRDGHTCQYCEATLPVRELNIDHVIPRSRGGRSTWDNLVTSCRDCNLRKGQRLPLECGMVPRTPPRRPQWAVVVHLLASPRRFEEWEPFLAAAPAE